MKRKLIFGLLALFSFTIGANIYTDIRGYDKGIFNWVDLLLPVDLSSFSSHFFSHPFLVYNLPDGLWLFSLNLLLLTIWNFQLNKQSLSWLLGAFCIGIVLEFMQYTHLIRGTFDAKDLFSYGMACVVTLLITLINSINEKAKSKCIVLNGNNYFWISRLGFRSICR